MEGRVTTVTKVVQLGAKGIEETDVDHQEEALQKVESTTFKLGKYFISCLDMYLICKTLYQIKNQEKNIYFIKYNLI